MEKVNCPDCGGSKKDRISIHDDACYRCNGLGEIDKFQPYKDCFVNEQVIYEGLYGRIDDNEKGEGRIEINNECNMSIKISDIMELTGKRYKFIKRQRTGEKNRKNEEKTIPVYELYPTD